MITREIYMPGMKRAQVDIKQVVVSFFIEK